MKNQGPKDQCTNAIMNFEQRPMNLESTIWMDGMTMNEWKWLGDKMYDNMVKNIFPMSDDFSQLHAQKPTHNDTQVPIILD